MGSKNRQIQEQTIGMRYTAYETLHTAAGSGELYDVESIATPQ